MKALSLFLVFLLFTNLLRAQEPPLHVTVVAGEGAKEFSNTKAKVDPAVQVDDDNGKPVADATVIFSLPKQGPGGFFENGSKSQTVLTDAQGRATAHGIHLNRLKGPFTIQVAATYQTRTGAAAINEKSVRGSRAGGPFGVSTKTWLLFGLGLVVIAGGIFAYKEFKPGANGNVLTATPGIPVVGGPK